MRALPDALRLAVFAGAVLMAACGARLPPAATIVRPPETLPSLFPGSQPDLVPALLSTSSAHFADGRRALEAGYLNTARMQFDRALDVLLESPSGARLEPRLREQFDRLVQSISSLEHIALEEGLGFVENADDPATIDELLAVNTFSSPSLETQAKAASDLRVTPHDIHIPMNARVLASVERFKGKQKRSLEEALGRSIHYLPMIQGIFLAEGLPLDLSYIPLIESAFKTSALSPASAKGLWQFMRGTGIENGLQYNWYLDERFEAEKSTIAAARYLKTLYGMFDNWPLALASYNAGPGRVRRAMRRSGKDDFWTLSSSGRFLPRETRNYVPLILAAVVIAKNPGLYGLSIPEAPPPAPETQVVTIPSAVDLRRIAERSGTSVDTIKALNPTVRRWMTPLRAENFALRVPDDAADALRAWVASASPAELAPVNWHSVRKGETLSAIARKLRVSRSDLAEANYLAVRSRLAIGQQLMVPRAPKLLLAEGRDHPIAVATSESDAALPGIPRKSTHPNARPGATLSAMYLVKRGDTLGSIARRHRTTVAALKSLNRLRSDAIRTGDRLTTSTEVATVVYRVKQGDTLGSIAQRHRTTVGSLKRMNSLRSDTIHPGDRLTTSSPPASQKAATVVYLVKRGDTLGSIARRHRTTVGSLKRMNSLRSDAIHPGDRLTIS
jgi:membrane-bound lytic murein transglycosylase D